MESNYHLRRQEKEIRNPEKMKAILAATDYVTIAMCRDNEPYLVTLNHGYDRERNAIYFHCAAAGKKIDFLAANDRVWGQALVDYGYAEGRCDHSFACVHFQGRVSFVADVAEKRHALETMIRQLENEPEKVLAAKVTEASLAKVKIGRIDVDFLSGKSTEEKVVSP